MKYYTESSKLLWGPKDHISTLGLLFMCYQAPESRHEQTGAGESGALHERFIRNTKKLKMPHGILVLYCTYSFAIYILVYYMWVILAYYCRGYL